MAHTHTHTHPLWSPLLATAAKLVPAPVHLLIELTCQLKGPASTLTSQLAAAWRIQPQGGLFHM